MKTTNGIFVAFFLMLILLSGCNNFVSQTSSYDSCFGSFGQFAYDFPKDHEIENTLPTQPWEFVKIVPEVQSEYTIVSEVTNSRYSDMQKEIWIRRYPYGAYIEGDDEQDDLFTYAIFYPSMNEWQFISAEIENTRVFAENVYFTSDGSIWAANIWNTFRGGKIAPILSRFNEETSKFEFVESVSGVANYDGLTKTEIILDHNEIFWFFVPKDGIYSFNPATEVLKQHYSGLEEYTDIALTNDNNFFVLWAFTLTSSKLEENSIAIFDSHTSELKTIAIPTRRWPVFGDILVTSTDNLWGDAVGYRDTRGEWHLIYPAPWKHFFQSNVLSPLRWENPHIYMESSNGWLWFGRHYPTKRGMAWLDPETGEGCWFMTNDYTNIIEDSEHTMWLIANDRLYKFPLVE